MTNLRTLTNVELLMLLEQQRHKLPILNELVERLWTQESNPNNLRRCGIDNIVTQV